MDRFAKILFIFIPVVILAAYFRVQFSEASSEDVEKYGLAWGNYVRENIQTIDGLTLVALMQAVLITVLCWNTKMRNVGIVFGVWFAITYLYHILHLNILTNTIYCTTWGVWTTIIILYVTERFRKSGV